MTKKGLSDVRISELTGIPRITLAKWKIKEDYRRDLYNLLKVSDESFLIASFPNGARVRKKEDNQ